MSDLKQQVVVLGASAKPERYSNRALRLLLEHGHEVIPVHPALADIEGLPVVARLESIDTPVDTVTLYVSAQISSPLAEALIQLKPKRVIFNPGTENPSLRAKLVAVGILCEEACTLVLLNTGQF